MKHAMKPWARWLMSLALMPLGLMLLFASGARACQVVASDYIYASDLAAAMPLFATLNPAIEVGFSPLPGVTRVFHSIELLRLARANGILLPVAPAEICFERNGGLVRAANGIKAAPTVLPPLAVKRGEKATVTVISGGVVLKFESEAESSGREGDTVIMRNPENGNRFAARVEDQGRVVVNK